MTQRIIMIVLITSVLGLMACNSDSQKSEGETIPIAQQITIDELENQLVLLQKGKTEFDFFGITSNGIDCIYFMKDVDKFQIEFEVMEREQITYFNSLKQYGKTINVETLETTYGNQPNYNSIRKAQVLRLVINADNKKAAEIGKQIQSDIFKNDENTKYDVVP